MQQETKDFYDFGPFRADTVRRLLLRDGQPVPVTSKVFDTLEVLIRNRDRVLGKVAGMIAMVNWPLYLKGDYRGGLGASNEALRVDPNFWMPYMYNGYNLLALERYPEAVVQFEKARSMNPESTINLSGLGATYARAGRRTEALAVVAQLNDMSSKQQYVSPMDYVYVYAAMGDREKAMEYLQRGYDDQSEMMLFLQLYGKYAGLEKDPRFQELQRKVRGS